VKNGGKDVLVATDGTELLQPLTPVIPVDTTGAGDSFNAGWIAARHRGLDVKASLHAAHDLARHVVSIRGALG
jgi:2-dehydro-3-deoxygluconokinase